MTAICFQLIVFNSDFVLRECLSSIAPYGPIVSTEGPVDYWRKQGYMTSTDKTNEILQEFNIPTVHGQWNEKDEMANASLALVPDDTEFIWVVDSDEIWDSHTIEAIMRRLETGDVDSMSFKANSFYGGFERIMTGFEENFEVHRIQRYSPSARWATHRPPTMLAPDSKPWREHNHLNHEATDALGWRFFHYSYVWPSQMKMKADYYHDRDPRGTIENYFERVYLPWVMGPHAKRAAIEKEFSGVHNWLPTRRGPCYTKRYEGEHPYHIQQNMKVLRSRFIQELSSL